MDHAFTAAGSFAPALWTGACCAFGSALLILLLPARGDAAARDLSAR
jgi:hypothetical protein